MYHANALTSLSVIGLAQKPKVVWGIHHSLASPKDESISTKIALGLSKILSKQPNSIIYCAHSSLEQHQAFGFQNPNSEVIANGVFLDKFQPNPALHQPTVIGFAGRYHLAKGYPYLFETMGLLKDENIIFKIAGSGVSFENVDVKALFEQYQLDAEKVHLLDQISNMPAFYQSIDAFLMTSITEGFPNVLVEPWHQVCRCISTDVGDAKYIVQDLGSIVPPRNAQALADAILAYVQKTEAEKQRFKLATRERVEQNFSIETVSRQSMQGVEPTGMKFLMISSFLPSVLNFRGKCWKPFMRKAMKFTSWRLNLHTFPKNSKNCKPWAIICMKFPCSVPAPIRLLI